MQLEGIACGIEKVGASIAARPRAPFRPQRGGCVSSQNRCAAETSARKPKELLISDPHWTSAQFIEDQS
jgi:hypothetical protein